MAQGLVGHIGQFNVYQREHFAIRISGHEHNHCSEDEESNVSTFVKVFDFD